MDKRRGAEVKHRINYDKDLDAVCVEVVGEFKPQDADASFEIIDDQFKDTGYYRLLIDLSSSNGNLSAQARRRLKERLKAKDVARIAFVITRPSSRMIAKVVVAVSGGSDNKGFFKSRVQAREWLKGEE